MRRRGYLGALVGTMGCVAGCLGTLGTAGARCGEGCDVGMSTNAFVPQSLSVTVGTTIVWKNTGSRAHTVTAYESKLPAGASFFATGGYSTEGAARSDWRSDLGGGLDPGATYSHTFTIVGEYPYFCIPHERQGMVGSIEVREE